MKNWPSDAIRRQVTPDFPSTWGYIRPPLSKQGNKDLDELERRIDKILKARNQKVRKGSIKNGKTL